jgi:hypothetical protein
MNERLDSCPSAPKAPKKKPFAFYAVSLVVVAALAVGGALLWGRPKAGDIIRFGPYDWRVLAVEGGKALVIAEDIIERRAYNDDWEDVTWETCTLRQYLNGAFYGSFSAGEQAQIHETEAENRDNQWLGAKGGNPTRDNIFLLSIEEVVKYFGDSGRLENKNPDSKYWFGDQYNSERVANFNDIGFWWWLRSPGGTQNLAAGVCGDGSVNLLGDGIDGTVGGVRPALWLNLKS